MTSDDARFAQYVEQVLDQIWNTDPEWAFAVGYYKYSDRLEVPDAASRAARLKLAANELAALKRFDESRLSPANRVDLVLLRNQFESDIWYVTVFRDWQWQPSQYNVGDSFARQLDTEYAPLEKRLRDMLARLGKVPAYYAAARKNIDRPTLEDTELALDQNKGALDVFGDELLKTVDGVGPDERREGAVQRACRGGQGRDPGLRGLPHRSCRQAQAGRRAQLPHRQGAVRAEVRVRHPVWLHGRSSCTRRRWPRRRACSTAWKRPPASCGQSTWATSRCRPTAST